MRVNIKGIHIVTKTLAEGTKRYYYRTSRFSGAVTFWTETGRRANLQSPAFVQAYNEALEQTRELPGDTFRPLIRAYRQSIVDSVTLEESTKREYLKELAPVEERWGNVPRRAFNDKRIRGDARRWRDSMSNTPRAADARIACLSRVCQYAYDDGELDLNHIAGIPKIYKQKKDQKPWTDEEISLYMHGKPDKGIGPCSVFLRWQHTFARLTGIRRGDQVIVPINADKGNKLDWKTAKRGKRVVIPIVPELRALLDEIKTYRLQHGVTCTTILFSSHHTPWKAEGLSTSTQRRRKLCGIKPRMHRLRGNATLTLCVAGFSDEEVAHIIGWSKETVADMRRIYIDQNDVIDAQIARLSEHRQ